MTEAQFQQRIVDYCEWLRLLCYHVERSDKGQVTSKGFPDLVIVGNRVIFAELKSQKGVQSASQKDWEAKLQVAGAETYLWRPSDWDEVAQVLHGLR